MSGPLWPARQADVAIVSGPRTAQPMGLESAERRLLDALRSSPGGLALELRVVGGRAARRYARSVGGRWHPARPGRTPRGACRAAGLIHLIGLDLAPPPKGTVVATIHDLAALRFPDEGRLSSWVPEIAARAAGLITPSTFTAGEVEELLGVPRERIHVIANGPGQHVSPQTPPLEADELAALGLERPFVLRLGGFTQRKNFPVILDAWPAVRRLTGASLAVAGPPQAARDEQLAQAPSRDGVVVLDYVPAPLVPRLVRSATAVVSTSTYEGFGLPPLEAMGAGTAVVAVRSGAIGEVCADAALLVDNDAAQLADALVRVLTDEPLRERLRLAGVRRAECFSWEKAASELVAMYRALEAG